MEEIFRVPELLEMILLYLDMKTLLVSASRVCRRWSETMTESPQIQQALFFSPAPSSSEEPKVRRPELFALNPLLFEKFGTCFFDVNREYAYHRRADSFLRMPWAPRQALKARGPPSSLSGMKPTALSKCFTRTRASWRRMLVSQPPPPFLGYIWYDKLSSLFPRAQVAFIQPTSALRQDEVGNGIVMGQLYDMVQHTACQAADYSVWFKISWDKPHPYYPTNFCEQQCKDLLLRTNVAVEFYERPDMGSWECSPWRIATVKSVFHCEDHCPPEIDNLIKVKAIEFEPAELDLERSVFWGDEP
ncbi:hypothetical protein FDECE_14740 [Fusarium decemcellulare]|nr:hypothetical protein FDECE_14740 [Fusarium decemcellulare]